jgi:CRISPR-associated protein Cpf1
MEKLNPFTNLYQLSKTLRFELRPIGDTLENIKKGEILSRDRHRADSYKKVKKIIDRYHKDFIGKSLSKFSFDKEHLDEYLRLFHIKNRDEKQDAFEKVQAILRKEITKTFDTGRLFSKELIKEDLLKFADNEEERQLIEEFKNFTTYFTGFNENRQNVYSDEEKSTAIAYRLIHENLPKFISNINVFEKVKDVLSSEIKAVYAGLREDLQAKEIGEFFKLDCYEKFLTQKQIDIYNTVIGGKTLKNEAKTQGLNEYINLYNQQQNSKSAHLPRFTPLFKQILSDRETLSWLPERFTSDNEVLESIEKVYREIDENVFNGEYSLENLLLHINGFDLSKIYLRNDNGLTDISQRFLGGYSVITNAIKEKYINDYPKKQRESQEKYDDRINKKFRSANSFTIAFINECLKDKNIVDYFELLNKNEGNEDLFTTVKNNYLDVKPLLNTNYPEGKLLIQDEKNIILIKQFLDSLKKLQYFVKPLLGEGNEGDKDMRFYYELEKLWSELDKITPLYNMVRNYVTQKPYSTQKIKLNFENSTLLAGWDMNKERDNTSVLLRKDGLYYLAIMDKKHNMVFEDFPKSDGGYEKIDYKLLPGANKMLPKVFFSKSRIDEFKPSKSLLENYENGTHKKGGNFNLGDCRALIDFFKSSIQKHEDWKKFDFHFSDTSKYNDLSEFYREVEQQGYKITFRNISEDYINQLIKDGKIYLFQIYNKDFSPYSKGTPNIHTLYFKALFDDENLKNTVYKLNGQAEIFFREKSIKSENRIIHKAQDPIDNKNDSNPKKQSVFSYDIVKDRRYTADKFQLHVPITLNFKAIGDEYVNQRANQYIKDGNVRHVIGIDRGERNLLYVSLIDLNGNIIEQISLNKIGETETDYHYLLDKKEEDREKARKNWQIIENIKELKEGYLSQAIYKITQLMIEYNAIIILEDLNFGFMRGRQKVEKQVYQKFEKMLIDKLNYLVDKKKPKTEIGGLLNAYQLSGKFKSFKEIGKQNGFLFYTSAYYTSKIDPVTGFVNMFDTRYTNLENAKAFFQKFADIRYNDSKSYFEFIVDDYQKFNPKTENTRLDWVICTNGSRIRTFRNPQKNNQWDNEEINLNDEFIGLFDKHRISYKSDLKDEILKQTEKDFFEKLLHLFKLTVQMRNSITETQVDYIVSPVADKNGEFFDSRKEKSNLPKDADANGAYNIARKGLLTIERIKRADNLRKVDLFITNKEWLQYAQK